MFRMCELEIDEGVLWNAVFHGSPVMAAIALAILDEKHNGKITELKEKIEKGDYVNG